MKQSELDAAYLRYDICNRSEYYVTGKLYLNQHIFYTIKKTNIYLPNLFQPIIARVYKSNLD